jgi:hypothetical protein
MVAPPFCPNPVCHYHLHAPPYLWFIRKGYRLTQTFGSVPRFQCMLCGRGFSTQTFSIDYYAKRLVDYPSLIERQANAESIRGMSRAMDLSCGTVQNRIDRFSRQCIAVQAELRTKAVCAEDVCVDGFVSFDVSQFFPSEITFSITSHSRLLLELTHATKRRSGRMSAGQKAHAKRIYSAVTFERGAIQRSFSDILHALGSERPPTRHHPLVIITDEKKEHEDVLRRSSLWRHQDEDHRVGHVRVNSKMPRTFRNPLFAANYLDREIRKDQAGHHRETTCFNRNVSNGMSRLLCYLVRHNFVKSYAIKARAEDQRVHGEVAGIVRSLIDRRMEAAYVRRSFLTRLTLPSTLEKIWRKSFSTPLKLKPDYLPAYAMG